MTKSWGANATDWKNFTGLGLTKDLLPVVSNPERPIASYSSMKSTGKTPSKFNRQGEIVGIAGWTKKDTIQAEVIAWSSEPDYGICVQTRYMRALDIDVGLPEVADAIRSFVEDWVEDCWPIRVRSNSSKCLMPFFLEGDFGKRVVKTEGGMIEFLATGQQFIAAGTHPSGVPYEWQGKPLSKDNVATLNENQFEDLWYALCEEFGTEAPSESRGARNYQYEGEHTDFTSKYLIDHGHVHGSGRDGQVYFECPFIDEHSTEGCGTDTAYFPAGSGGYEKGHFACLHASCSSRCDEDFLDAFGVRVAQFDVVEVTKEQAEEEVKNVKPLWMLSKQGKPEASLHNVRMALEAPNIVKCIPAFDVFRDEIIFYSPDKATWRRESDELFIELRMRLEAVHGFEPIGREKMRDTVLWVAKRNVVDTATEWLEAQVWDGVPRIESFVTKYLGADDSAYTRAASLYLWTGLAGRIMVPALKADMIMVLKSPEGYKKSSAIEAIAPTPDEFVEIDFSEKDDDLARKMRGKVVAEIAELRGLRTRELESILAFVTRRYEEWIPKYREYSTKFPRRLMFIATTNEQEFLDGARTHRRWLPINVTNEADVPAIERDRKQLWAEARERFLKDGLLFGEAEKLGLDSRDEFRIVDSWEDAVSDWLGSPCDLDDGTPSEQEFIRTLDIARSALNIDPRNLKRLDEMRIGATMKALGYDSVRVYDKDAGKQIRVWKKDSLV